MGGIVERVESKKKSLPVLAELNNATVSCVQQQRSFLLPLATWLIMQTESSPLQHLLLS